MYEPDKVLCSIDMSMKHFYNLSGAINKLMYKMMGVGSIPALSHNFAMIDYEIISTFIFLYPLIQEGCCQLQPKVCERSTS